MNPGERKLVHGLAIFEGVALLGALILFLIIIGNTLVRIDDNLGSTRASASAANTNAQNLPDLVDSITGSLVTIEHDVQPVKGQLDTINSGLTTISGGLGTALAPKSKNKGNWSADGAVKIAHAACEAHQTHVGNHLLWVYWQETGGDVLKNTTATQGMHARLDQFLFDIKDKKSPKPNVIGHDFVSETTCSKIAKMNLDVMNKF